jgi:hypothetical protein
MVQWCSGLRFLGGEDPENLGHFKRHPSILGTLSTLLSALRITIDGPRERKTSCQVPPASTHLPNAPSFN